MAEKSYRMFSGRYVSGDEYRCFGPTITSLIIRFDRETARTPYNKAVLYPSHLSKQEIETFRFKNRDLISPWDTPAGQFLLNAVSSSEIHLPFETFQKMRRDLLARFARNVDGNLTIVNPRAEAEPKRGTLHDFILPILSDSQRLITINGEYKATFISAYRQAVNRVRNKQKYGESDYSAPVYRIR